MSWSYVPPQMVTWSAETCSEALRIRFKLSNAEISDLSIESFRHEGEQVLTVTMRPDRPDLMGTVIYGEPGAHK